jgi:hypothetical protein
MISLGRIFAAAGLSLFLVACNRGDLPKLEKGEALRADCAILLNKYPEGEIPKAAWPRSVNDLKSIRVVREKDGIRIFTFEKNGRYTGGYCVFSDPQFAPSTQGVWIRKTEFKGIYQFRM